MRGLLQTDTYQRDVPMKRLDDWRRTSLVSGLAGLVATAIIAALVFGHPRTTIAVPEASVFLIYSLGSVTLYLWWRSAEYLRRRAK
jgi:hypothetical protein